MLLRKILKIWALRNAISCILSHFQATLLYFKEKIEDRCPNYFRHSTSFRQFFLILLSKICIVKILSDFRETGMDPDNNGDKRPSVAIASEKLAELVIWMHNNLKLSF